MGAYTDDVVVCYDYLGPDSSPRLLSFSATVKAKAHGGTIRLQQKDVVDNPGSRPNHNKLQVEVNR
jgi:hypothetical protein